MRFIIGEKWDYFVLYSFGYWSLEFDQCGVEGVSGKKENAYIGMNID